MSTLESRSVRRREDQRLLTGGGNYADDAQSRGMLHAVLVRSPHAHATDHQYRRHRRSRHAWRRRGLYRGRFDRRQTNPRRHRLPASRRQPVGEDRPPVAGQRPGPFRWRTGRAGAGREPRRRPGSRRGGDRRLQRTPRGHRPDGGDGARRAAGVGRVSRQHRLPVETRRRRRRPRPTCKAAAHVTKLEFSVSRVTANTMEPRGAWAEIGPDGRMVVHASNQSPFNLRNGMANGNFGIPPTDIRVHARRRRRLLRHEIRRPRRKSSSSPGPHAN